MSGHCRTRRSHARPRRPREVGATPTRSRHCKRGAARQTDVTGRSHAWEDSTCRADPRVRKPGCRGRPSSCRQDDAFTARRGATHSWREPPARETPEGGTMHPALRGVRLHADDARPKPHATSNEHSPVCRSRLGRFRRSSVTVLAVFVLVLIAGRAIGADEVAGVVVGPAGQPVPRARVKSGTESTFADEAGRFRITPPAGDCRLDVSQTGFQPAVVSCNGLQTIRIVLVVAPIEETVVVTATRTEAPASQVGASVTAFTADDLDRR